MNILVNKIVPGSPENSQSFISVEMNSFKDDKKPLSSRVIVETWVDKDIIKNLSLQQVHDLAIDRVFDLLRSALDNRSAAILRSGF